VQAGPKSADISASREDSIALWDTCLRLLAILLMIWPVGELAVSPAIKDLLAPGTRGKQLRGFQFFTMLTRNKLACFLVDGPVRFLTRGITVTCCVTARAIQSF
jgi:hypothetical protein